MATNPQSSSRDRVLSAAIEILSGSDMAPRFSVRTIASRAGVSVGSLRYHFPTQRALRDAALERIYDAAIPQVSMDDVSICAQDRLFACLRSILDSGGHPSDARSSMTRVVATFVSVEQTEDLRETYFAIAHEGLRRIERGLTLLAEEGALPLDTFPERARFLDTVLDGIFLQRALPTLDGAIGVEDRTLRFAIDAVLTGD